MNLPLAVKEELSEVGSLASGDSNQWRSSGLHELGTPPFLTKTYDMVEDPETDQIVSWSSASTSFVVWDPHAFSMTLLPKYFKHGNFSSFVRQLNTYLNGKVDPDRWEFANQGFIKGERNLLKSIRRRKPPTHPLNQHHPIAPCLEVGQFGLDGEIERLKRDKNILMSELVKLRQEHQNTRAYIQAMEERIQGTEQKQQQMMTFLARAMQNPSFIQQFVQQKERRKEIEEAINKKRRRSIDTVSSPGVQVEASPDDLFRPPEISEIDYLADEMDFEEGGDDLEDVHEENLGKELNDEFWEDLLGESVVDESAGNAGIT